MTTYKFLADDGVGVFSRFAWPLPADGPGAWVESEVETCRAGIHACRAADLPFWVTGALYEIELGGGVDEQPLKVVAPRGRLLRRVDGWDDRTREAYGQMCFSRANELAAAASGQLDGWAPGPEIGLSESARLGFIAALIAELVDGPAAHLEERKRQSDWLVEQRVLD